MQASASRKARAHIGMISAGLPDDLWVEIFSHLSARMLCDLMPVCRHWFYLCRSDTLWQQAYRRTWPVLAPMERHRLKPRKQTW